MKAQNIPVCVAKFCKGVGEVDCFEALQAVQLVSVMAQSNIAAAGHSLLHRLQLLLRLPHLQRQASRVQLGLQGVARLPHAGDAPCEEV